MGDLGWPEHETNALSCGQAPLHREVLMTVPLTPASAICAVTKEFVCHELRVATTAQPTYRASLPLGRNYEWQGHGELSCLTLSN